MNDKINCPKRDCYGIMFLWNNGNIYECYICGSCYQAEHVGYWYLYESGLLGVKPERTIKSLKTI